LAGSAALAPVGYGPFDLDRNIRQDRSSLLAYSLAQGGTDDYDCCSIARACSE
jgi:hypothetical protein